MSGVSEGREGTDMTRDKLTLVSEKRLRQLLKISEIAADFVQNREEATEKIWNCDGDKGRALLEAFGIPYVEKL